MEYRKLGNTGLEVSVVGLGCAMLGSPDTSYAVRLIQRAIELGVNYMDAARAYRDAETKLGIALEGMRDRVVLSTKTGGKTRDEAWRDIETSLQELRTDHLENIHLHGIGPGEDMDIRTAPDGALTALIEAKEQGVTAHIGATSHRADTLVEALQRFPFEIILVPMNYVEQQPLEQLIPLCQERGVGVTIMKPLATGLLPAPLALKWLIGQPIHSAVPGATAIEEAEENSLLGNSGGVFDQSESAALTESKAYWDTRRCRICIDCLPCPAGINLPMDLGTDVIYDHYRTMGPEEFRTFTWSRRAMEQELPKRKRRIAQFRACTECGDCEPRCPYGLPIIEMLKQRIPGMIDMVNVFEELLAKEP